MSEPPLAAEAAAAARMLLAPPDGVLLAALAPAMRAPLEAEEARQDFYDFLCVPQSGRYIPPYAHVLSRGEREAEFWQFPPPRFDGGDGLRVWYQAFGFDPARLAADPLIAGPNRPLDHAGFILAYLSCLLEAARAEPLGPAVLRGFLESHFGSWFDLLAELLGVSGSPYLMLLGGGLAEFAFDLRAAFALESEERVDAAPAVARG
jgi:Nitrate reductase delta subunit